MGNSQDFSDWEQVHDPCSPPPQVHPRLDFDLVIKDNFYDDGSSIFPPSDHQDLPLSAEDSKSDSTEEDDVVSVSYLPSAFSDASSPKINSDSKLSVMAGEIKVKMCALGQRMLKVLGSSDRKCSSVVRATALALALFACVKFLQWRKSIFVLVKEKDQRIRQLLNQIAEMNEILSAPRKVPILRIY